MSYVPRNYEETVRDLLTYLTGGTVRESLTVPPEGEPIELEKLFDRPVRRVSHLEGYMCVGVGASEREIPYRFTTTDFELVSTSGNEGDKDLIRFREDGRHPAPGSTLTVNYYPVQTNPVPLTDLNVGSVIRTLMETFAYELALSYQHLDHVYKSAFLETAEGSSLDKIVALVGLTRLPAHHPLVKVRFSRRPGTPGQITVPAGSAVTNKAGNRYLTLSSVTLEPNETTREVMASGEGAGTPPVAEGNIDRLEMMIAGISGVTNPQPAYHTSAPETDDDLRRRARDALHGVVRGTEAALRFAILSVPGVQGVNIIPEPNGVAGEIEIEVAYSDGGTEAQDEVVRQIDEFRPAGIRVILGQAAHTRVNVRVELTLAGAGMTEAEVSTLTGNVEGRLFDYLSAIPPGGKARQAKLTALVLEDDQIVDTTVTLSPETGEETTELTLAEGEFLEVLKPFNFPPPEYEEQAGTTPATTATVSAILPIYLEEGVTLAEATSAINPALDGHLASRGPEAPLNVDSLAAAVRDESRFALAREDVVVTVETADGQFLQLTDGVGEYTPDENETLVKDAIDIEALE
jgi:uncharacterized phage protein gp47/JayE